MANIELGVTQITDQYLGPMFANLDLVDYPQVSLDDLLLRKRGYWRRRFDASGKVHYRDVKPSAEIAEMAPMYLLTVTDRANEYRFVFRMPTVLEAATEGFVSPYNIIELSRWSLTL